MIMGLICRFGFSARQFKTTDRCDQSILRIFTYYTILETREGGTEYGGQFYCFYAVF